MKKVLRSGISIFMSALLCILMLTVGFSATAVGDVPTLKDIVIDEIAAVQLI